MIKSQPTAPREGCGRMLLAGLAGTGAFYGSLLPAVILGSMLVRGSTVPGLEAVAWAGAGLVAALVAGAVAPGRSVALGVPLVVALETTSVGAYVYLLAVGEYAAPATVYLGGAAGIGLGLAAALLTHPLDRSQRGQAALGGVGLLVVGVVLTAMTATAGPASLARLSPGAGKGGILTKIEEILRKDVLAQAGTVTWGEPAYHTWSSGETVISVQGELSTPHMSVYVEMRPRDVKRGTAPLRIKEMRLLFPELKQVPEERALGPGVYLPQMWARGVRPELLRLMKPQGTALVAMLHGLSYTCDTKQVSGSDTIRLASSIQISGTYAPEGGQ